MVLLPNTLLKFVFLVCSKAYGANYILLCVRFEVKMLILVFRVVTPHGFVGKHQGFAGMYGLNLQG
jgi:hypothetical protein